MRKKKAIINILFSFLLELVNVVSGFIVPGLLINSFGSDANGLVNSISSFIGYIAILQLGVGSVIKASLYKPLASNDKKLLDSIIRTTESFFVKIGIATLIYIIILAFLFPTVLATQFAPMYTVSLVVIIGIGTVAQYLFGITYQMLLEADQKSYVYSIVQIITVILNTIFIIVLVNIGSSIHIVKLCSSVFFVLRPLIINAYVRRKYQINRKAPQNKSYISQRWDGFSQGLAYFIHSKTDIFVLTLFSDYSTVSIYSVYTLVTLGLSSMVSCIDKAVRSALGNIFAKEEKESLIRSFNAYNMLMHLFITSCFATASITVFKFVSVYVYNVQDANYIQPLFGVLIITAEMFYCLRMPHNSIIFVAGKFKETKASAYIEAGINITLSCILVKNYGLVGIAIGTLAAMIYRTISFIIFLHSNILSFKYFEQIKRYIITLIVYSCLVFGISKIDVTITGYFSWILYAGSVFITTSVLTVLINYIFDRNAMLHAFRMLIGVRVGWNCPPIQKTEE